MGSKRHQVAAKGRAAASAPKSARDSTLAPTPIAVPHSTFREHGSVTHPGYALSFYSSFIFMCIGWTQATMVCLCMTGWYIWRDRRYELPVSVLRRLPFFLAPDRREIEILEAHRRARAAAPELPEEREQREHKERVIQREQRASRFIVFPLIVLAGASGYWCNMDKIAQLKLETQERYASARRQLQKAWRFRQRAGLPAEF